MRNLICRCEKLGNFYLNLSNFFPKREREGLLPPLTCTPVYHTIKEKKKKTANGNACLKGTETGPCDVQGKAFFFQLYTNETHHRYLSRIFAIYTVGTLERERSV